MVEVLAALGGVNWRLSQTQGRSAGQDPLYSPVAEVQSLTDLVD